MNKPVIKWVSGITATAGLAALIGSSAIRLNAMEEKTEKVDGMEFEIRVISITLKLLFPDKYRQAEELAK